MAQEERQAAELETPQVPRRLVKCWLPAELVRDLDVHIVRSGAYLDRAEFIAEAIRDRLDEERVGPAVSPPAVLAASPAEPISPAASDHRFGDWLDLEPVTLPKAVGPEENFGLHNRDWPTLWALDWLGRESAMRQRPVGWSEFVAALVPRAWEAGRAFAGESGVVGFPTNQKRKEATEQRFIAHAVGLLGNRGRTNSGPLFVFGLVGLDGANAAPTAAAVSLVAALRDVDAGSGPPFSERAWRAFAAYLASEAPRELDSWLYVLRLVAAEPSRTELVERCTRWSGSKAATNAMSYVARGREWGLVESDLVDGRYRLTDVGQAAVAASADDRKENVA